MLKPMIVATVLATSLMSSASAAPLTRNTPEMMRTTVSSLNSGKTACTAMPTKPNEPAAIACVEMKADQERIIVALDTKGKFRNAKQAEKDAFASVACILGFPNVKFDQTLFIAYPNDDKDRTSMVICYTAPKPIK